jgi:GT2 family glycosyltransferase
MGDNRFPLVSIISVNFNQTEVTAELLKSLEKITYPNREIIIVDNGSTEDPTGPLADLFPEVILLKSEQNLGLAGGNNLGARCAKGEFMLFINNDTEVDPNFLEPLVARLQSDSRIGMVSPKIRFFHTPDTIQYAGYTPLSRITLRQHLIGYRERDTGQYDSARPTYSIHGAAMMIPRHVISRVGLMAEMYFLYYEEHDWAERIKRAGYILYYEPASLVFHKESISTGKKSPLKIYYINRNRFLFARRNCKGGQKYAALLYLSLIAFPKALFLYLAEGRFDLAKSVCKAYIWNLQIRKYKG